MLLAIAGVGMGTIFPVTTVAVQNAVEPHQLGTATASFNFFRSLGSAILVAVFGAIFLGGLGLGGRAIGSLDALVAAAAANGTAVAPVFSYVFGAAAAILAGGFLCFAAMRNCAAQGALIAATALRRGCGLRTAATTAASSAGRAAGTGTAR